MYDRSYMTPSSDDTAKKTLTWIIGANVVVFVLQNIFDLSGGPGIVARFFAFHHDSLQSGMVWTPITYSFLHSTGSLLPLHLIFNMVVIYFFGRAAMTALGQKRFLQLYFGAVLVGGLAWFAASFVSGAGSVIGASAAASALLIFFACLNPDREVLLFFVIPVKPRYLAYFYVGIGILGLFFQELFAKGPNAVAHSAHLGGMLFAFLFHKYVYQPNPYDNSGTVSLSFARFFKKRPKTEKSTSGYTYRVNVSRDTRDLKEEVDRILDKINSKGFASLSSKEKEVLDEARDLLRKR
ncbi:rhomboid family intramembrane serine protease [Pelagicoccus sp. SDUM812002]|uniref:rhomboid family intramembrane serine protease n=1 Tax=Pelagicoccus sp. SDUM812002 TaxID=3041266 RepID=UPI00280D6866|nr:rhomboid family intramembrane serine protease [Pelagicoccus sp. SDUM812002]MDQ8187884.1 rhomboid family intramembrane serine protease [Pelagicoccus sp. SDUM812002]